MLVYWIYNSPQMITRSHAPDLNPSSAWSHNWFLIRLLSLLCSSAKYEQLATFQRLQFPIKVGGPRLGWSLWNMFCQTWSYYCRSCPKWCTSGPGFLPSCLPVFSAWPIVLPLPLLRLRKNLVYCVNTIASLVVTRKVKQSRFSQQLQLQTASHTHRVLCYRSYTWLIWMWEKTASFSENDWLVPIDFFFLEHWNP